MSGQNPFDQQPPSGAGPSPWQTPTGPDRGPGPAEPGDGIPWENEQTPNTLFESMKVLLLEPGDTFGSAEPERGIGAALVFALILGTIGGVLSVAAQMVIGMGAAPADLPEELQAYALLMAPSFATLILVPPALVIGLFVNAGLVHLSLLILGGGEGGFGATFRSLAFASGSTSLFQIVPGIGALVAFIWSVIIQVQGLKELHQISGGKAVAAVFLPIVVCCCCILAIFGAAAGTLAGALSDM